ncbi:MAG: hypothetical protein QOI43_402, partial [Gaiellales bacterium]|nr:hypothetical protein [Gaiellales bacterium]
VTLLGRAPGLVELRHEATVAPVG